LSRDPVFGHVTYFSVHKTLNISRTVTDRNKIQNTRNRKLTIADQMHMLVLSQLVT